MRRTAGVIVVGLLLVASAACSSSSKSADSTTTGSGATSGLDGNITVYSGQHEQTVASLTSAFQKESGIKVTVRSDDESTLANQLLQEGSDTPADVFFAENPPALNTLDEHDLLAKTDPATLAKVNSAYSPASGDWVGVSARAAALAYNTGQVQESDLPSSIVDLAEPAWKGKVGFAPTETDFQPLVTSMVNARGVDATEQWLKGLKTNAKVYADNEALVAAVDKGEVETGILDHYYWYRLRDEVGASKVHSALHYFANGDPGSLVDVSGAGQTASSNHPKSAQAFLAFLVSAAGQKVIANGESYEYPLGSGVQATKVARPLSAFGTPKDTITELGDGRQAITLMQQAGLLE